MNEKLEECVKKIRIKRLKDNEEIMLLKKECPECSYCGIIKIHYCQNKKIRQAYYNNEQLSLPFKKQGE
jgi:hypothetical protein